MEEENIHQEFVAVDYFINFHTDPPILIPKTNRAKEMMGLPEGVEGAIVMGPADAVLRSFPEDYTYLETEEFPNFVAIATMEVLH